MDLHTHHHQHHALPFQAPPPTAIQLPSPPPLQQQQQQPVITRCLTYEDWCTETRRIGAPMSAYKEYVAAWVKNKKKTFFDNHWSQEWFINLYEPDDVENEQVKARALTILSATSPPPPSLDGPTVKSELSSHMLLLAPFVKCTIPRSSFIEVLPSPDSAQILFGEPMVRGDEVCRKVVIACRSQASYSAIVAQRQGHLMLKTSTGTVERVLVVPWNHPEPRTVSWASEPTRLELDLKRASELARAMDKAYGVIDGVDALLTKRVAVVGAEDAVNTDVTKTKLDYVLGYLRSVHHCCYYAAMRFSSVDAMLCNPTCTAPVVRVTKMVEDEKVSDEAANDMKPDLLEENHKGEDDNNNNTSTATESSKQPTDKPTATQPDVATAAAVDKFVSDLLETLSSEQCVTRDRKRVEIKAGFTEARNVIDSFIKSTTFSDKPVHQCVIAPLTCSKLFKGPDFAKKHIQNIHAAELKAAEGTKIKTLLMELYEADPNALCPNIPKYATEALSIPDPVVVSVPGVSSSFSMHGSTPAPSLPFTGNSSSLIRRYRDPDAPPAQTAIVLRTGTPTTASTSVVASTTTATAATSATKRVKVLYDDTL